MTCLLALKALELVNMIRLTAKDVPKELINMEIRAYAFAPPPTVYNPSNLQLPKTFDEVSKDYLEDELGPIGFTPRDNLSNSATGVGTNVQQAFKEKVQNNIW